VSRQNCSPVPPLTIRQPRGISPSESIASTTAYGKDTGPKTARQIAAAAAKASAAAKQQRQVDDSEDDTGDDEPRGGRKSTAMAVTASNDSLAPAGALGIDIGKSREGSAGKSGGVTPSGNGSKGAKRGQKRGHGDDDDDDDDEDEDVPPAKRTTAKKVAATATAGAGYDSADLGDDGAVDDNLDSKVYCTCRQVSFGEMIGCDDDDCEIEWVSPWRRLADRCHRRGSQTPPSVLTASTTSRVSTSTRRPRATGSARSASSGGSATRRRRSRPRL
jgi:inhibitor of growth protein 3